MSETTITLEVIHQGRQGTVQMEFDEWVGDQMPISFEDRLYNNAGTIRVGPATSSDPLVQQRICRVGLAKLEATLVRNFHGRFEENQAPFGLQRIGPPPQRFAHEC